LMVGGAIKAQLNNVKTQIGEPTKLNFDLKQSSASGAKNATHMVYVPAETGSHMGGRWVEVDDKGNADGASVNNIQRTGAGSLGRMQSNSGTAAPGGGQ